MVFGFDPRKLVKDQQEEEKKKVEEVVSEQEKYDLLKEENEARLRKKSNIKDALEDAFKIIRETKFRIKEGDDAYYDYKKRKDPSYQDPREYAEGEIFITPSELKNMERGGKKVKNLEEEYGDEEPIKPQLASYEASGTTGKIKTESTKDPLSSDIGIRESIGYAIISGGLKIPYGFANLGAMILDYADKNKLPVDQSRVARLDRWFEDTFAGQVMKFSSEKAKENAIGRLTEVLVQMYGGWATVGSKGVGLTDEAFRMFNNAMDAIKKGKYVKTSKNTNLARGVKTLKNLIIYLVNKNLFLSL